MDGGIVILRRLLHAVGEVDDGSDDAPTDPAADPMGMHSGDSSTLRSIKIASFFIVPICTFAGAIPALKSRRLLANTVLLSYCNTLAGAILLGFGFLHILPDAVESFDPYIDRVKGFPIIYAMTLFGFFAVLIIEKGIMNRLEFLRARALSSGQNAPAYDVGDVTVSTETTEKPTAIQLEKRPMEIDAEHCHTHGAGACAFHTHDVVISGGDNSNVPWHYSPLLLTFGLSPHSIFEGLALGLQDGTRGLVLLLVGIVLHKWAEAFALGVNLAKANVPIWRALAIVGVFSLVCPIGIGIGYGVRADLNQEAQDIVSGLLQGVAVGVFMYITILGMVVEEFAGGNKLPQKFALAMIGCAAMGCISFFE